MSRLPWIPTSIALGVALAGCSASTLPMATTGAALQRQPGASPAQRVARKACPDVRSEPRCLVLVESNSGISPLVAGWGPADFQARYKLPSTTKGSGQIVAIVDAYDNPDVATDLATYRSYFGLGKAKFKKFNQKGQQSNYPSGSTGWGIEIDLDVEMVSASCPLCTIYLVEADGSYSSDLQAAEVEAVKLGAHIVSNSWICYASLSCVDQGDFAKKGVTYLAAAGDDGIGQEGAPEAFDTVVAVGGTVLSKNGSQYSETPWDNTGGGCAAGIKKPRWQHDHYCTGRLANDAAAVAWDVAEYDSYGYGGWFTVGGTSVASPLLAGVFGLAGNPTKQDGGKTFWQTSHHEDLYDISGCSGYGYTQYSICVGWGTPNGIGAF